MRCEFCGAQIKEGSNVCEYCGSTVENAEPKFRTIIKESPKPQGAIVKIICKSVIVLACVWIIAAVVSLIAVLHSDVLEKYPVYVEDTAAYGLPRNAAGLAGTVAHCDSKGNASIEYEGSVYENVKILDEALLTWINETDRTLDTVGICFATDENGDISELGLLSAGFFVMGKDNVRYIAIRDGEAIAFTSETPLKTDCYYNGYFSYPDMRLYAAEEENPVRLSYMDAECEDKGSMSMWEYYTGEEIEAYQILVNGTWYYCSWETYEAVQKGDMLNGYQMYDSGKLAFIVKDLDG